MVKRSLILLLIFALGLCPTAWAAKVRAVPDRDRIAVGESLQLQLRIDGSTDDEPDLQPLQADWEVLGRSQSSQMQLINGDFSRSTVYRLTLMPRKSGTVTIPPICFGHDCTEAVPIRVAAAKGGGAGATTDTQLQLEAQAEPTAAVAQGQVLLRVRLLRRVDLLQGSLSEPQPQGVDAVVKKLGDDRRYQVRRQGRRYQVIERDYALFPQAAGTLKIPPVQFDGTIATGPSPFGPFGGQGRQIRLRSQPLTIRVAPPPADLGQRTWLPAHSLQLQDDWQGKARHLTVGEPATRTLTLTAAGLTAAQLPSLALTPPAGFKSYPDQPKLKDRTDADGITGVRQQKIALVPTRPGRFQLPAIDLAWWDTQQQRWQQAHLDPVEIEVAPAAGRAAAPPTAAPAPTPPPAPATAPLPVTPTAPAPTGLAAAGFWPWLCLALAAGWLLTLTLLLRRRRPAAARRDASAEEAAVGERDARKAVLRAARSHDARGTRQALRHWCRLRWSHPPDAGLERLRQAASPALGIALDALDRSLYAASATPWDGTALVQALNDWRPPAAERGGQELPDLYPPPDQG